MKKFDTKIQILKYSVLKEVAKRAWKGGVGDALLTIPKEIVSGKKPTMRCCVYKERAILSERVGLALGGDKSNSNVIEVIVDACDACPSAGFSVTDACRGCVAHKCYDSCKFDAIIFDAHQKAHIDVSKCKNCGACAKVCPYSAITEYKRPCQKACKCKAITMNEDGAAFIHNDKCTACGACVYNCPFGSLVDKSYILNAIELLKNSKGNSEYKTYAVVAPAISSQFNYAKTGQVIAGIKALGFSTVVEAALGADMVAYSESEELAEKGFLLSSCCPAFVSFVENNYPTLVPYISSNISPAAAISKYLKEKDPTARIVFIGPCTAKKKEFQKDTVKDFVDAVITFEELQALFDSRDIEITALGEDSLDMASYFGRIFARCGGLAEAVRQGLSERGLDFELKAVSCDGIEACNIALLKALKNRDNVNFIEGMACLGGCVGGAGCLTHADKNRVYVDNYSMSATEKSIAESIKKMDK